MSKKKEKRHKLVKSILFIVSIVSLVILLENYGWWGLLFWILGITIYRAWVMREQIKQMSIYIETMIWGKPLKKEYWEKGELKNTKVELYYKGKRLGGSEHGK